MEQPQSRKRYTPVFVRIVLVFNRTTPSTKEIYTCLCGLCLYLMEQPQSRKRYTLVCANCNCKLYCLRDK